MQRQVFMFELELAAVTFSQFEEIFELPYGHPSRILHQLLAATGGRISEIDDMDPAMIVDGWLTWHPGKNQRGTRTEYLPASLRAEIAFYRRSHRTLNSRILGPVVDTQRRRFDKFDREVIAGSWTGRVSRYRKRIGYTDGWRLTLKGYRKTFQTVLFAYFYHKYGDAYVAAEMVAKRMKHSDKGTTLQHYIEDYTRIEVDRWLEWFETGRSPIQRRMHEFSQESSVREERVVRRFRRLSSRISRPHPTSLR